jgi:hypothetical protein
MCIYREHHGYINVVQVIGYWSSKTRWSGVQQRSGPPLVSSQVGGPKRPKTYYYSSLCKMLLGQGQIYRNLFPVQESITTVTNWMDQLANGLGTATRHRYIHSMQLSKMDSPNSGVNLPPRAAHPNYGKKEEKTEKSIKILTIMSSRYTVDI